MLASGYLEDAEAHDMDDMQVAVLKRAAAEGAIAFEDYQEAIHRSIECISDAGYHTEIYPADESRGFPVIGYFYEGPESGNPVADACIRMHSEAIEALYQMQPSSVSAQDQVFLDGLDDLEACLARAGVNWDTEGKTVDELWTELLEIRQTEPLPSDGTLGPIRGCEPPTGS